MQIAKRTGPFPLLELPFELRRMVYYEILAPGGIDHHRAVYDSGVPVEYCIEGKWGGTKKRYVAAVQYDKQRANFLVASKQINAEGSAVFYDDIHTAKVAIFRCMSMDTIRTGSTGIMLMPTYLPRLRRVEICLRLTRLGGSESDFTYNAETGHFTRLCHELAAQCHALKDVVLELSCTCSRQTPQSDNWTSPVGSEDDVCFTAEEFERVLKPLERVRVSRSLQLKSSCKLLAELQPVFNRSATVVRSSDPVKELEGNELIWWQLMEKGRPYFRDHSDLRTSLHMAHEVARVPMLIKLGCSYIVECVKQLIDEKAEKANREHIPQSTSKKRKASEMALDPTTTSQKKRSWKRARAATKSNGQSAGNLCSC